MLHYSPAEQPINISRNVAVTVDDAQLSIQSTHWADERFFQSIRQRMEDAQYVRFDDWSQVAWLPEDLSSRLLTLANIVTTSIQYCVPGIREPFGDPLQATMALHVDPRDLQAAAHLRAFAIRVAAVRHPTIPDHQASLIKDWLARNGVNEGRTTAIAREIREAAGHPGEVTPVTPQSAAEAVLATLQEWRANGGEDFSLSPPVRSYQGDFYVWRDQRWTRDEQFDFGVANILRECFPNHSLTKSFVDSVLFHIESQTHVKATDQRLPLLFGDNPNDAPSSAKALVMDNGILDLCQLPDSPSFCALTPRLFSTTFLPVRYNPEATSPLWLQTLHDIFPSRGDNDRRIEVLQEFFGYALLPWNHSLEKCIILIGRGANGKSTILHVLRSLLGRRNVSNAPLEALQSEFRVADMLGKFANVASDMQRLDRVQDGLLKQLISGEPTQINRKYCDPCTAYPTAKLFFATNYLPPLSDTSDGVWRRMIVVPLYEQFREDRQDCQRASRLHQELPGIFNWAVAGAQRLMQQERFSACGICDHARSIYRYDSDPVLQFVDEVCVVGSQHQILVDSLYAAYRRHCEASGRRPKSKTEFGRQLHEIPGVERFRSSSGARPYFYSGIATRHSPTPEFPR